MTKPPSTVEQTPEDDPSGREARRLSRVLLRSITRKHRDMIGLRATGGRSPPGWAKVARIALVGPGAAAGALLVALGLTIRLPPGRAGVDQIVVAVLLLPLIWATLFFYTLLDASVRRAAVVVAALALPNAAVLAWRIVS